MQVSAGVAPDLAEGELPNFLRSLEEADKLPFEWLLSAPPAVTARVGDELAGVGVLRPDGLHPKRSWAAALVGPAFRRQGVGTALHHALVDFSSRPLKTRLPPSATDGQAFADALGLALLVRSHLIRLDAATHLVPVPDGRADFEIAAADPADPEFRAGLAALYRRIHEWDPPTPGADAEIANLLCAEVAFALAARRKGQLIGVALAHRTDRSDQVEAAMIGTVSPDEPGGSATTALLTAVLKTAGTVEVEVDEGQGAHRELSDIVRRLSPLPLDPTLILATA